SLTLENVDTRTTTRRGDARARKSGLNDERVQMRSEIVSGEEQEVGGGDVKRASGSRVSDAGENDSDDGSATSRFASRVSSISAAAVWIRLPCDPQLCADPRSCDETRPFACRAQCSGAMAAACTAGMAPCAHAA